MIIVIAQSHLALLLYLHWVRILATADDHCAVNSIWSSASAVSGRPAERFRFLTRRYREVVIQYQFKP